jgi:hypothetical protein
VIASYTGAAQLIVDGGEPVPVMLHVEARHLEEFGLPIRSDWMGQITSGVNVASLVGETVVVCLKGGRSGRAVINDVAGNFIGLDGPPI